MADREGVVDLAPDLSFHGARLARAALGRACHPNGKVVEDPTPMKRTIQVRIFRGEQKYVAECLDLPVVTEAATLDELAANIREAISLHLEGEDLAAMACRRILPSWPPWSFRRSPDAQATRADWRRSHPHFARFGFQEVSQRGSHVKLRRVLV